MEKTMRRIAIKSLLPALLFLLSCGGEDPVDPNEVVVSSELINVSDVTMLPEGGEKQITVNANCAWVITVPAADSWLTVNPSAGANTRTVTVSCAPNTSTNSRTSVITISGKQRTTAFKVTQNGIEVVPIAISGFSFGSMTANSVDYSFSFSPFSDNIKGCGVCFSKDKEAPSIEDGTSQGSRNGNVVTGTLSPLETNTRYFVRAFVTNASGTYYSQTREVTVSFDVTFSSFAFGSVTASSVDYSFAFSPSNIETGACGVCFSKDKEAPAIEDGTSQGSRNGNVVTGTLSPLEANTRYFVRAFVTLQSGTYYSQTREVTTENNAPGNDDNRPPTTN